MKKHFLATLLVTCVFSLSLKAQWELLDTPEYENPNYQCSSGYKGCIVSNTMIYWIINATCTVGGMGQFSEYYIYLSSDGGYTWNLMDGAQLTQGGIQSVSFCNPTTGSINMTLWPESQIFRSADCFNTKQPCTTTTESIYINSIMVNYDKIFVIDLDSKILHLENDSIVEIYQLPFDLEEISFPPPKFVYTPNESLYLSCRSETNGNYANDLILKSEDEGYSWDTSFISNTLHIHHFVFFNDSLGFAVGEDGLIMKTTNAGTSWYQLISGINNDLYCIDYKDELTWIIGGNNGIILYTEDGGDSWIQLVSPPMASIGTIIFPEKDQVLMIKTGSYLYKTDIDLLTSVSEQKATKVLRITPNPANDKIIVSYEDLNKYTRISIFTVNGEKVLEQELVDNETQFGISTLQRGVYFVRVQNEGMAEVTKFVKQ